MQKSIEARLLQFVIFLILIPFLLIGLFQFISNNPWQLLSTNNHLEPLVRAESKIIFEFESYLNTSDKSFKNFKFSNDNGFFNRYIIINDAHVIYDSKGLLKSNDEASLINDSNFIKKHLLTNSNTENYYLLLEPTSKYSQEASNKIIFPLLFIALLLAIISISIFVFTKYLSKQLLEPINRINLSIFQISKGHYDIDIPSFDTKEINTLAKNLQALKEQLKINWNQYYEYDRSKKELIAKVAHDLKTPLASIKGYVEGLQDDIITDPSTRSRYLEVIHDKTDKLNLLIEDLLIFSQLDLDHYTYNFQRVNSQTFINEYLHEKSIEFEDKTIDFIIKRPIISTLIKIDTKRIIQVFENIISNSTKFTNSYIIFSTKLTEEYLSISIEDNGIGIHPKDQKHIFDLFYKADDARSNPDSSGSGLGLNICKQIISDHQGYIELESQINKRTRFTVFLPIDI